MRTLVKTTIIVIVLLIAALVTPITFVVVKHEWYAWRLQTQLVAFAADEELHVLSHRRSIRNAGAGDHCLIKVAIVVTKDQQDVMDGVADSFMARRFDSNENAQKLEKYVSHSEDETTFMVSDGPYGRTIDPRCI